MNQQKLRAEWGSVPENFETLAIYGSSSPESFSSKCVVTPIVTSTNFMMRGAGSTSLEENEPEVEVSIYRYAFFCLKHFVSSASGNK
jgi:hypothetical protein